MNQTKLTPKPDLTLLAVVVPNNAYDFRISMTGLIYYMPKEMNATKHYDIREGEIIGLFSKLTEEHAKEIVPFTECYGAIFFTNYMNKRGFKRNGVDSLQSLIESSGLTYTNEEDILLIKVN